MAKIKNFSTKPAAAPTKPAALTPEQKAEQIARFFSQKRETLATGILFNLLQTKEALTFRTVSKDGVVVNAIDIRGVVDAAIEGADYFIEKFWPLPDNEKTDEK